MTHQTDKDTHKLRRLKDKRIEAWGNYTDACGKHGSDSDSAIRAMAEYQKFDDHITEELHKAK